MGKESNRKMLTQPPMTSSKNNLRFSMILQEAEHRIKYAFGDWGIASSYLLFLRMNLEDIRFQENKEQIQKIIKYLEQALLEDTGTS